WKGLELDLLSSFENMAQPSALTACGATTFTNIALADLHLPNCESRIHAKGMIPSSPVPILYDIDGDFRKAPDIGADEIGGAITFVGTTSTDWNNPNNWDLKYVPSCSDSVIISSNGSIVSTASGNITVKRQPTLSTSHKAYFKSIYVQKNA